MPRTFVDLSGHPENDVPSDPRGFGPNIQYFTHEIRGASAGWARAVAIFDDALPAGV